MDLPEVACVNLMTGVVRSKLYMKQVQCSMISIVMSASSQGAQHALGAGCTSVVSG